jgi:hypothetical protein
MMTFFIVISRALKQWLFYWNIYKIPNKISRLKAVIGFIALNALWIWALIFYYKVYLPYEGYEYPLLSKMNIDSGIWVFSHDKNKLDYVLKSDGEKILFDYNAIISTYRKNIMKSKGLNPLSKFDPEIHVKVWWFSKPNIRANTIGQLEIEGKIASSYQEEYKAYFKNKNHSSFYAFIKIFSTLILMLFIWEFIEQYNKYKEESE